MTLRAVAAATVCTSIVLGVVQARTQEEAVSPPALCLPSSPSAGASQTGPAWNGWGVTSANTRFQPADAARLSAADVPRLKLKWAFGFPDTNEASAQPAVVGGRVYVGS